MNPAPRVVQEPLGLNVAPGESATLRVEVAGDPAPTVAWYREGVAFGRARPELVLSPTPGPVAGSYTAEVSNRHGVGLVPHRASGGPHGRRETGGVDQPVVPRARASRRQRDDRWVCARRHGKEVRAP